MKNLYFRILHSLLIKPYLYWALNIGVILIIRIMFAQTVYADSWDWNPGRFLLSEPETVNETDTDIGVICYPESIKQLASLLISSEMNAQDDSKTEDDSKIEDDSDIGEEYNSERVIDYKNPEQVLEKCLEIGYRVKNSGELTQQIMALVQNIVPIQLLILDKVGQAPTVTFMRQPGFDLHCESILNVETSTLHEHIAKHSYLAALNLSLTINTTCFYQGPLPPPESVVDIYMEAFRTSLDNDEIFYKVWENLDK